jgi:hypothetical protein
MNCRSISIDLLKSHQTVSSCHQDSNFLDHLPQWMASKGTPPLEWPQTEMKNKIGRLWGLELSLVTVVARHGA